MQWSEIDFNPPPRTLRQFAGLFVVFFGGLAAWRGLVRNEPTLALVLAALALVVGLPGLAFPKAMRPVYAGWMALAFPIGWVVSRVIFVVLFYGLFTPIGFVFRLIGRDSLGRRHRPDQVSHWLPKRATRDPRRYLRQF